MTGDIGRDELVEDFTIWWAPIELTAQELVIDDDTPEAKLLFTGGYGSGKTSTMIGKTLKLSAINGDIPGIVLVPDYGHFEDTILEKLKSEDPDTGRRWFLDDSQFHYKITRHGAHILEWEGGGPWHIMSAVRPASIKGPERAWMTCDEPGIASWESWRAAVNRVRHPSSVLRQVGAFGTPEGLNWLAQLFTETHDGSYYMVYRMNTADNRELLKHQPDYMKQVLEHATEQEAQSYLGGAMVNLTGAMAYGTFDRATHWLEDVPIYPELPLRITFDFNVDPMSCVIAQIVAGQWGRHLNVVDAVIKGTSWTPQICDMIIERYGRDASVKRFGAQGSRGWPGGAIIYGDATGGFGSTTSQKSNYDIIKEMLGPQFPEFQVHTTVLQRYNPPEVDRLNSMRAIFKNARGHVKCAIRKTKPANMCTTYALVRSLEMSQIAPGTSHLHKPAGETHTHPGDALGYLVNAEFPARVADLISPMSFSSQDV